MSSETKEFRRYLKDTNSREVNHSMNQRRLARLLDKERKAFGTEDKAVKAMERRNRIRWYEEVYPTLGYRIRKGIMDLLDGGGGLPIRWFWWQIILAALPSL